MGYQPLAARPPFPPEALARAGCWRRLCATLHEARPDHGPRSPRGALCGCRILACGAVLRLGTCRNWLVLRPLDRPRNSLKREVGEPSRLLDCGQLSVPTFAVR